MLTQKAMETAISFKDTEIKNKEIYDRNSGENHYRIIQVFFFFLAWEVFYVNSQNAETLHMLHNLCKAFSISLSKLMYKSFQIFLCQPHYLYTMSNPNKYLLIINQFSKSKNVSQDTFLDSSFFRASNIKHFFKTGRLQDKLFI